MGWRILLCILITPDGRAADAPRWSAPAVASFAVILVTACFIGVRVPYFTAWRLPVAFPDTATYLWPLQSVEAGTWPAFDLRTPGYPLFWWLCRQINHDIMTVVYVQNALSLATSIFAVLLMARFARRLVVPVALTLAVFVSGNAHLMWDVSLLSESLFTSTLIAWASCLFLALHTRRWAFSLSASWACAAAIMLRPSALPLAGILVLLAVWMRKAGYRARCVAALLAPVALLVFALFLYNLATIRVPGLSAGGTWAALWSTSLYLDPDQRLEDNLNAAVRAKDAALSAADRAAIYQPRDLSTFRSAVERNIGAGIGQIADRVTGWPTRTGWKYMEYRPALQRAVSIAIRQHPWLYALNFVGTFVDCFRFIAVPHPNFYVAFPASTLYSNAFVTQPFYIRNLEGYYSLRAPRGFSVSRDSSAGETRTLKLYRLFAEWRSRIFENGFWPWTLPISAVFVGVVIYRAGRLSAGTVTWLALVGAVVGNALSAALIGHAEPRYAQPFYFVNYLAAALLAAGLPQGGA